jgi:hypothetical protein
MSDYLKYGSIGLIAIVLILIFRLVVSEQKKDKEKRSYKGIFVYLPIAIILVFIGIYAEYLKNHPTLANPKYVWNHYERNGFKVDIPSIFKEKVVTNDLVCYSTDINDNIQLDFKCTQAATEDSILKLFATMLAKYPNVSYQFLNNKYFVITGQKNDNTVYYYKGVVKGSKYHLMSIEYPSSCQYLFDDIMGKLSLSFK